MGLILQNLLSVAGLNMQDVESDLVQFSECLQMALKSGDQAVVDFALKGWVTVVLKDPPKRIGSNKVASHLQACWDTVMKKCANTVSYATVCPCKEKVSNFAAHVLSAHKLNGGK
jgi:hypothetical protein